MVATLQENWIRDFRILYCCGPQSFWHQGLVSWKTICSRTREGERGDDSSAVGFELLRESNAVVDLTEAVMWGMESGCKYRWSFACLLAWPPSTSCCVAQFLTGHGPVLIHGLGVGDPCYTGFQSKKQGSSSPRKQEAKRKPMEIHGQAVTPAFCCQASILFAAGSCSSDSL